jgi:hypothetical protein
MAPGVGGELGLGAHPDFDTFEVYSYRNQRANKHQVNWLTPPGECLLLISRGLGMGRGG